MTEKGKCGHCGSEDLDYESSYPQDEYYCYPFTCNNCNESGTEWHELVFSETIMKGDKDDE